MKPLILAAILIGAPFDAGNETSMMRDETSRLRAERDDYLSRLMASRRWWQFRKAI